MVRTISGALVAASLLFPAAAHAATPAQIHADATDGVIDGEYSMAELRAADETVSPELREYYGWDEAYGEYLRGSSQLPTAAPAGARAPVPAGAPPPVSARGTGGGAAIGREKSPSLNTGDFSAGTTPEPMRRDDAPVIAPEVSRASPSAGARDVAPAEARESDAAAAELLPIDDGSGGFPFVFVLLAVPLVVLGVGVWRSVRQRAARSEARARRAG